MQGFLLTDLTDASYGLLGTRCWFFSGSVKAATVEAIPVLDCAHFLLFQVFSFPQVGEEVEVSIPIWMRLIRMHLAPLVSQEFACGWASMEPFPGGGE